MASEDRDYGDYDDGERRPMDISSIVDESANSFRDAVDVLDRTFTSGRNMMESVIEVIEKIRE